MDLFELKREFLEYCELDKGQSSLTISGYDRYLNRFFEWLKNYKIVSNNQQLAGEQDNLEDSQLQAINCKPEDITQESIRQYRLHINRLSDRSGRELKKTTQNYHILAIRAFLRYLAFRGIASLSPEKVSIAKTGDRNITFLESDEIANVLNAPSLNVDSGARDRAILEVLFSTGMRVSELVSLNIEDINFERGEIAVLGKGKKLRVVFLSENSINVLREYLLERGCAIDQGWKEELEKSKVDLSLHKNTPLFLSKKNTRLTVRSIERIVKKYSIKAGLAKKVSPHTLRHSFATDLLISGADIRSVQSLLGHSSITTTQVYTHVTDQHLRDIHKNFHGKSLKEGDRNGHSDQSEEPNKSKD